MSVLIQLAKDPGEFQLLSAFFNSRPPGSFDSWSVSLLSWPLMGIEYDFCGGHRQLLSGGQKRALYSCGCGGQKSYIVSPAEDIVCGEHLASSAGDSCISIRGCRCPHAYDLAFADGSWSRAGITCIRPHKDRTLRIALLEIRWKLVACMQYLDAIIPMDVGPYRWQRPLQ